MRTKYVGPIKRSIRSINIFRAYSSRKNTIYCQQLFLYVFCTQIIRAKLVLEITIKSVKVKMGSYYKTHIQSNC